MKRNFQLFVWACLTTTLFAQNSLLRLESDHLNQFMIRSVVTKKMGSLDLLERLPLFSVIIDSINHRSGKSPRIIADTCFATSVESE